MSGVMGRGRRRTKRIKNNKRNLAEATVAGRSPRASGGQPGSLTRPDLEGHHLAQQLLQPAGPQVAAVIRTPRKGRGGFGEPDCASEGSEARLGSALLQIPK